MSHIVPELGEDKLQQLSSSAEARVYRACRDSLCPPTVVIFSLPWIRVSAHGKPRDGETDFIVFDEARGILIIEVKGGGVRVDSSSGTWSSLDRHGKAHTIKDPFRQATSEKYALQDFLRGSHKWDALGLHPTIGHAVLFPDLDAVSALTGPDRPIEIIGSRGDVTNLSGWVSALFNFWSNGTPVGVGPAGMKVVKDLFCAAREVQPLLCHQLEEEENQHIRLTEEQSRVIRALGRRNRVAVSGGAGTGKTLLAFDKARELAASGLNTLLVCYNRPLADHLANCAGDRPLLHVMNFHQLCDRLIRAATERSGVGLLEDARQANPGSDQFDVHFPHALAMATEILPERFDAIIVDEAQDFGEEYWFPIELLLRDAARSVLFIFYDHNQSVYRRAASFPIKEEPYLLTKNCRNTRFIHTAAYAYYEGEATEPPPIEGASIQILDAPSRGSQGKKLHSHLVSLLDAEKVTAESVAVLVPSRDHRAFYDLLLERPLPKPARWAVEEHNSRHGIRVDTVQRFKGLEAAIVYLWGADELDKVRDRELLYVTLSRAKSRLFLVGDGEKCQRVIEQALPG